MSLIELVAQFSAIMWQAARRARDLEARLPDEIDLPVFEAELAAIVASLG